MFRTPPHLHLRDTSGDPQCDSKDVPRENLSRVIVLAALFYNEVPDTGLFMEERWHLQCRTLDV